MSVMYSQGGERRICSALTFSKLTKDSCEKSDFDSKVQGAETTCFKWDDTSAGLWTILWEVKDVNVILDTFLTFKIFFQLSWGPEIHHKTHPDEKSIGFLFIPAVYSFTYIIEFLDPHIQSFPSLA